MLSIGVDELDTRDTLYCLAIVLVTAIVNIRYV